MRPSPPESTCLNASLAGETTARWIRRKPSWRIPPRRPWRSRKGLMPYHQSLFGRQALPVSGDVFDVNIVGVEGGDDVDAKPHEPGERIAVCRFALYPGSRPELTSWKLW